ncbi:polysaccharide deacetylase family protein [Desulfosporosinus fructosivorans]|uniref:Polysaccharide deacetylase family protein n=1 Tax=Desulfosporosinus fructosivorans TaxID=2018669 RepID=A0A4Z0QZ47_9FIRM|nr:polysaccharide deacetylase family protein [Desulfosporosinus fructosivorans]TGE36081.1 polysaccharide deacetylase family protein [Desulfosporosinus fructosivorans]
MRIYVLSRRKLVLLFLFLLTTGGVLAITQSSLTAPSLVRAPGTYYMANTQEKTIALTFDDGPDPIDTPDILTILKEKNVRATFFVLGQAVQANPHLVKRLVMEGHEIGNHSFNHDYQQRRLVEEIKQTDQEVFASTGVHTYFYRPPGGFLSKNQLETVKKNGHIVALWSVDSKDWRNPGVKQIVDNVMKNVFPGAIILLHDGGYQRTQTVKALGPIIDALRDRGYRMVTLSELKMLDSEIK